MMRKWERKRKRKSIYKTLCAVQEVIAAHQYLSRDTSAGRHDIDILEAYIHGYPGDAFLAYSACIVHHFGTLLMY